MDNNFSTLLAHTNVATYDGVMHWYSRVDDCYIVWYSYHVWLSGVFDTYITPCWYRSVEDRS